MRILGIDPGTRYRGYGVVERAGAGRVSYVECGVIEPRRTAALHAAGGDRGGLREVLDELRPEAVAVEGVFHGVNARSALQLGHARGVALAPAGERTLPVLEYAPATVKRTVAGYGAATKTQVSAMVRACARSSGAPQARRLRRAGGGNLPRFRLRRLARCK